MPKEPEQYLSNSKLITWQYLSKIKTITVWQHQKPNAITA